MIRAHKLKTWPEPFFAVEREKKTCELRKADRDFKVGDFLMLLEFDPARDRFTGRYLCREITHVHRPEDVPRGLLEGFVILSIFPCDRIFEAALLGEGGMSIPSVTWIKP
jgi:hypothetical protein